ncbi:hypothetical protein Tco_0972151 [Tanacetum coccineum]
MQEDNQKIKERDAEMTDDGHDDVTQETTFDQVKDDAHITFIAAHVTQKTEVPLQSSSVSSDFATQFLNLDNVPPANNEIIYMMNVDVRHEDPSNQTPSLLTILVTVIPETSIAAATTIPLPIPPFTPFLQLSTPTSTPSPIPTKTLIPKLVKDIINDEVKTQLPLILPKAVSDFATPVIKITVIESLEDVVLARSSSQPQSTYEAVASLTKFELKKILIDKIEKSQSNHTADEHKELYKALVNSYNVDKDLFLVYGKAVSLKRGHEDHDKDEDPPAGSDQGMKRCATESKTRHGSRVELEYNNEEFYKTVTDRLIWNNPEGKKYPFDLSKSLPLIMDRGCQVVPVDYFIKNELEYLRGRSSSRKYTTSTTKTKAAKYDIHGIKDMVPSLWSLVKMFIKRIVILKRVKDLQLGVESYQKKLNITKPETFSSNISNRIPYTAYNNP